LGDRQDLYELALLSALPWTGKDFHYSLNNSIKTFLISQAEIFLVTIGNFWPAEHPSIRPFPAWPMPSPCGRLLKGELSLYCWPPVWLVWNQLYDYWQILFFFICKTD
jgi:hypothetical protein